MANFTENMKLTFLDALRETCNVSAAARQVGFNVSTVYYHRKEDIIFQQRWDEALQEGVELLEFKAQQRAFEGVDEPVFHKGYPSIVYQTDAEGHMIFETVEQEVDDPKSDTGKRIVMVQRPLPVIDPATGMPKLHAVRKYSDALTMFLLKAHAPERFRERSEVKQELSGGVALNDTTRHARLKALLAMAQARKDTPADDTSDLA